MSFVQNYFSPLPCIHPFIRSLLRGVQRMIFVFVRKKHAKNDVATSRLIKIPIVMFIKQYT